jgi:hypothetical protein
MSAPNDASSGPSPAFSFPISLSPAASAEQQAGGGAPQPSPSPRAGGARTPASPRNRRSMEGGRRSSRHLVEVPEGADKHEGLVVSRQEKVPACLPARY